MTALIEGSGLSKTYGNLTALRDANLKLKAGEVRALVGSNGAGKSTLIKILTGAIAPTTGTVKVGGKTVPTGSPRDMIAQGIACIYQHSNLAPAMSVLDNIFLGRQPTRFGLVDVKRQRLEAEALLAKHQIDIDLDALAGSLPTVKCKEVEILKALALDAQVIIMDEPTGWLSSSEVAKLHATIRALKAQGVGILYISHMLDEIFAICDTISVMRDGEVVAEANVPDVTRADVVRLMVGERLAGESERATMSERKPRGTGEVRLQVRDLGQSGTFSDVSFDLHAGEILCITGLIGSRRSELLRALFGADRHDHGDVMLDGRPLQVTSPRAAMAAGIGFVPEDRHHDGLMLGMTIRENLAMTLLDRLRRGVLLRRRAMENTARATIDTLAVHPRDPERMVGALSGGNQQKVLIGKWINRLPRVLILDEPTVGVDVGAKAEIYALLRRERDRGAAVLVVSSDLEEVATLADRIGVMVQGRLIAIHDAGTVDMAQIMREVGGEAVS